MDKIYFFRIAFWSNIEKMPGIKTERKIGVREFRSKKGSLRRKESERETEKKKQVSSECREPAFRTLFTFFSMTLQCQCNAH